MGTGGSGAAFGSAGSGELREEGTAVLSGTLENVRLNGFAECDPAVGK